MALDKKIERIMIKALDINLGHRPGEQLVIVAQRWAPSLGNGAKHVLERSLSLCEQLNDIYSKIGVPVTLLSYVPSAARSGVDPTEDLYKQFEDYEKERGVPEIIVAPCGYSITHTKWRKDQNEKGSRIATMSNCSLAMFAPDGPFDLQGSYEDVEKKTMEIADKLKKSKYVRITGPGTDLVIRVDNRLVHTSTGCLTEPGMYGNWLGAEAFAVPVHRGDSNGYFTTHKDWGGRSQLRYTTRFEIEKGGFVDAVAVVESQKAQEWVDKNIKPMIFGKKGYEVVAGLGFGTNPSISDDYLMKNWSIAVAEKKGGTVHIAHGNSKAMGGRNDVDIHQDFLITKIDDIKFGNTKTL